MVPTDSTSLLIRLVGGGVLALLAFVWSGSYERRFGTRPMKSPAWGWAVFCFVFPPLGLLALLVTEVLAHLRKPPAQPPAVPSHAAPTAPAATPWSGSSSPGTVVQAAQPPAGAASVGQTILPSGPTGRRRRPKG